MDQGISRLLVLYFNQNFEFRESQFGFITKADLQRFLAIIGSITDYCFQIDLNSMVKSTKDFINLLQQKSKK